MHYSPSSEVSTYDETGLFNIYMDQAKRYPLLSKEDEARLGALVMAGQEVSMPGSEAGIIIQALGNSYIALTTGYQPSVDPHRKLLIEEAEAAISTHGLTAAFKDPDFWKNRIKEKAEKAEEIFTNSNLRMVITVAKRLRRKETSFVDAVQEGNIGLMRAVQAFDYRKGYKFSTHAYWWVRRYVERQHENHGHTVRVPVHVIQHIRSYDMTALLLQQELGRKPLKAEVAQAMGVSEEEVNEHLFYARLLSLASLNEKRGHQSQSEMGELVAGPGTDDGFRNAELNRVNDSLMSLLGLLSEREAKVIVWLYGLFGSEELTATQVGELLGLSQQRISQIKKAAFKKMKEAGFRRAFQSFASDYFDAVEASYSDRMID